MKNGERKLAEALLRLGCPARVCSCGSDSHYHLRSRPRMLKCKMCGRERSVTGGMPLYRSRLSLETWFRILSRFTRDPGVSARVLAAHVGVQVRTASRILARIR